MEQREVTDSENTTWTCVQAYAGVMNKSAEETPEIKNDNGTVTVVCTPSGGAQTVRLELQPGWMETISDEDIVDKISSNR